MSIKLKIVFGVVTLSCKGCGVGVVRCLLYQMFLYVGARNYVVETNLPPAPERPVASADDIRTNSIKLYWGAIGENDQGSFYSVEKFTLQNQQVGAEEVKGQPAHKSTLNRSLYRIFNISKFIISV